MKTIECEEQGLGREYFTEDEIRTWVEYERAFWDDKGSLDRDLQTGVSRYQVKIVQHYRDRWTRVLSDCTEDPPNYSSLDDAIAKAQEMQIVLGHGVVGKNVDELIRRDETETAQRLVLVFSEGGELLADSSPLRSEFAALRSVLKFNPRLGSETRLHTIASVLSRVEDVEDRIGSLKSNLDEFVETRRSEIDDLANLYRTKLLLEGPAEHWASVARSSMRTVWVTLAIFSVMLAIPAYVVSVNWPSISAYLDKTIEASKGGFSLASVVVFTIPILAYGWLLKHISRIFTQALSITADASHRKVMAVTFLGLAQNKSLSISEQDRALILNALFRPIATASQDEGPPAGLLDLIKK
ncbi:hypothetical protein JS562_17145 [Agrobacterium sp. S2]|nr:hypothetical protein [Agrobacterium sp. S2]